MLVGAAVVTAFFCVSGVVIAWAGRIDDAFTLPAALGTFLVKALVFFAVLGALPADGWLDRLALAWAVIAGALLWSARPGAVGVDPAAVLRDPAGTARRPSPASRRSRAGPGKARATRLR